MDTLIDYKKLTPAQVAEKLLVCCDAPLNKEISTRDCFVNPDDSSQIFKIERLYVDDAYHGLESYYLGDIIHSENSSDPMSNQNQIELNFQNFVIAEDPHLAKFFPKVYYVSDDYRVILVENIPVDIVPIADIDYYNITDFAPKHPLVLWLKAKGYFSGEINKLSSWRRRENGDYVLIDAGVPDWVGGFLYD